MQTQICAIFVPKVTYIAEPSSPKLKQHLKELPLHESKKFMNVLSSTKLR